LGSSERIFSTNGLFGTMLVGSDFGREGQEACEDV
jgi:hypothetical protein